MGRELQHTDNVALDNHSASGISCVKVFVFRFPHPSGLPPDFLPKKQAQLRTMLLYVAEAVEHHFGNAHVAPRRFGRREHFIAHTLEFRFALIPSIRQIGEKLIFGVHAIRHLTSGV